MSSSQNKNDISSTIDRMINASTNNGGLGLSSSSNESSFISSSTWKGPKKGYYFGTSDQGTGYYVDHKTNGNGIAVANTNKRRRDDVGGDDSADSRRKVKVRFGQDEVKTFQKDHNEKTVVLSSKELLEQAEEEQRSKSTKTLDTSRGPSSIKSAILNLEKSINKNQLLRIQHPDNPAKFMNSEVALYEEIELWNDLAASIEYYSLFVQMGAVDTLKSLFIHDNLDVVLCVVKLFNELLDPELLASSDNDVNVVGEQLCTLMIAFLGWDENNDNQNGSSGGKSESSNSNCGLDMIIANLKRLDESEEEEELEGIDNILTLIENLLDLDQYGVLKLASAEEGKYDDEEKGESARKSIAAHLTQSTSFVSYLLMKLGDKKLESWNLTMKLHASEVLASIMQNENAKSGISNISSMVPYTSMFDDDDDNDKSGTKKKKKPNEFDGMECVLQAIAAYRKKDPSSDEECEYLENIFASLAASLLSDKNVEEFLERQGVELMLRCVNEHIHAGSCSMKILFFCVSGSSRSNEQAAEIFVEAGGLKSLFPILMGRKSSMPKPASCSDAGNIKLIRKYADLQKENRRKTSKQERKKPSKRMKQVLAANREWFQTLEGHSIQILYGLTRHLNDASPHDAKSRLVAKFLENECEKCDRLVELCLKYDAKMRQAEYDYYKSDEAEEAEESGIDVDIAAMNAKLKGGGDLFHRVSALIGFVALTSKRCHEQILEQLKIQNNGIGVVKAALNEFASLFGEESGQYQQLMAYLSAI